MGGGEGHRVWATTVLCRNWRPVRQTGRGGSSAIRINHGDLTALLYLQGYGRGEFAAERRVMEVLGEVVGYGLGRLLSLGRSRCRVACQADGRRSTHIRINYCDLTALLYL